ncbi:MAG TPA: hypothetical protein VFH28_02840 [Nitrososphaera sp.]|nr:hypothetical protein [Nitrososphaera sp.]
MTPFRRTRRFYRHQGQGRASKKLIEPIPENDTTGKGIIEEGEEALRLPFVMFGDRVSARSLTALSR